MKLGFIFLTQIALFWVGSDQWPDTSPTVFNIGGVLSSVESEHYFNETISVSNNSISFIRDVNISSLTIRQKQEFLIKESGGCMFQY